MRKSWGNRLTRLGRSLAGPSMASQKAKLLLWAGFMTSGQCFALMIKGEQCWLVKGEEAALKAAFDGHGW